MAVVNKTHVVWENKQEIEAVYAHVRDGNDEIEWFILEESDESRICLHSKGKGVKQFCEKFTGNYILFGFIRIKEGDTTKFIFVEWIGKHVEEKYKVKECEHGNHGNCVKRTVIKEYDCEQIYVAEIELNEDTLMNNVQ